MATEVIVEYLDIFERVTYATFFDPDPGPGPTITVTNLSIPPTISYTVNATVVAEPPLTNFSPSTPLLTIFAIPLQTSTSITSSSPTPNLPTNSPTNSTSQNSTFLYTL